MLEGDVFICRKIETSVDRHRLEKLKKKKSPKRFAWNLKE